MAEKVGDAFVEVSTRLDKLERGLRRGEKRTEKFGRRMRRLGQIAGTVFAAAVAGRGLIGVIRAASDAEEAASKFGVVFSDVGERAGKSAQDLAKNFGLSRTAAQGLLADTGDLLAGFGFTDAAALDLSLQVNELAVDLASFTNIQGGAQRASKALTKALLGERESIKELGIAILEADVLQRVAQNSAKGLTFATVRQAKAAATLQLATEQSTNAIGDFQRTQDSLANRVRTLQARFDDLRVSIGTFVINVFQIPDAIGAITRKVENLDQVLNNNLERMIRFSEVIKTTFKSVALSIRTPFIVLGVIIREVLATAVLNAFTAASNIKKIFKGQFNDLGDFVKADIGGVFDKTLKEIGELQDDIFRTMEVNVEKRLGNIVKSTKAVGTEAKAALGIFKDFGQILSRFQTGVLGGTGRGGGGAARAGGGGFAGGVAGNASAFGGGGGGAPGMILAELKRQTKLLERFAVFG